MSVHYKFKSALEFSTLPVDGVNISVEDLKEAIIQQKKLSKAQPFDLIITNAETNQEYSDEKTLIPKNSSLLIARVPIDPSQLKKPWNNHLKESTALLLSNPANLMNSEDSAEALKLGLLAMKVTDLTQMQGSEDDVIHAMMAQSTLDYHPSRYVKLRNSRMSGKVPASYTCYKCSKGGHWVSNCPLSNQDLRKSYGIPSDQLKRVTDPNTPGVMVTTRGTLVVYKNAPVADLPAPAGDEEPRQALPETLQCSLCEELMKDAVLVPCCAMPFCDECIRNHLIESDDNQCPKCIEANVSIGNLIPNRFLRKKCFEFDKQTNGNYIRSYEKLYSSPPSSVAPLPPHLRTATSAQATPSSSPLNKDAAEVSSTTNITSGPCKEPSSKPSSPDNREAATEKSVSDEIVSDKVPIVCNNVFTSAADTTSPSSSPTRNVPTIDIKVDEGETRQLYRGLLKDVEESERDSRSKIASPVQTEVEKIKKVKKKKEKKKKDSSKEKKKDKHRHGSKSTKSPRTESDLVAPGTESPQSAPKGGSGTDHSRSPVSRGTKRDRSSDSASSGSPSHERKIDSTSDLFNVALNIPFHPTSDSQGPYSDPFYPPVQQIFSVPPPGYPASTMYIPPVITETIDDPLEAFNKHLREQDERKRREQMRRYRSPSFSRHPPRNRSWSRSRSRSPGRRHRSRSPRSRRYKWSRSRSPISPRHHSQSSRHQVTPPSHRQYSPQPSHRQYTSPPLPYRQYSPSGRRLVSPAHHPSPSQQHHHHYDRIRSHSRSRLVSKGCRLGFGIITRNRTTITGGVMVLSR